MLSVQDLTYIHANKNVLFHGINLHVEKHKKIALVGNNGSGKSTLLRIISGELKPYSGQVISVTSYYVPQIFDRFADCSVAEVLRVDQKLNALREIEGGTITVENYEILDNEWTIEERCHEALERWQLSGIELMQPFSTLSGGQKVRVFLAGIQIYEPELILLDEPGNHLDGSGRTRLKELIQSVKNTVVLVSHDRELLNLVDTTYELDAGEIRAYGGNYDFYAVQKRIEREALHGELQSTQKALRIAREKERETLERRNKLDNRGKAKQQKAGVARIMMNTLRNNAEQSTTKIKSVHSEKISGISEELKQLKSKLPEIDRMKFDFDHSELHKGKVLFKCEGVNIDFGGKKLWREDVDVELVSGERIVVRGANGSGKTTLLKLIAGFLQPKKGAIRNALKRIIYLDQEYSLLEKSCSVYEQAQRFNLKGLEEHDLKIRLTRFLFTREEWDKPCYGLSGGERMRLALCCLTIDGRSPDLIILDEPTNNLDIQNIEVLTTALADYVGTLLVVSHDERFVKELKIDRTLLL